MPFPVNLSLSLPVSSGLAFSLCRLYLRELLLSWLGASFSGEMLTLHISSVLLSPVLLVAGPVFRVLYMWYF